MTAKKLKFTVRMDETLSERIAAYAKENELSKNQVIKQAVKYFLNTEDVQKKYGDKA